MFAASNTLSGPAMNNLKAQFSMVILNKIEKLIPNGVYGEHSNSTIVPTNNRTRCSKLNKRRLPHS